MESSPCSGWAVQMRESGGEGEWWVRLVGERKGMRASVRWVGGASFFDRRRDEAGVLVGPTLPDDSFPLHSGGCWWGHVRGGGVAWRPACAGWGRVAWSTVAHHIYDSTCLTAI
jgi:hypothetical protein